MSEEEKNVIDFTEPEKASDPEDLEEEHEEKFTKTKEVLLEAGVQALSAFLLHVAKSLKKW